MNVFGEQYPIDCIYEFLHNQQTILLPKRVVVTGIIQNFMLEKIRYVMGDELILIIDGKRTDLSRLYLAVSSSTSTRTKLPNSYRLLIRMIYFSYRMLLAQDKFTYDYLVRTYSNGFLGSRESELNYKKVIQLLVNELTRDPLIELSILYANINKQWNENRNANLILDANGKFVVDRSVYDLNSKNPASTPSPSVFTVDSTQAQNTEPDPSPEPKLTPIQCTKYATFYDKHYEISRIQQLPNGSYIPLMAFVDEMVKHIEIPPTYGVCNDYRTEVIMIHDGKRYNISSDYKLILDAYNPKRPLPTDLISIVARVYQILRLYPDITADSLVDLIDDQNKGSSAYYDDDEDINICIKYAMDAYQCNPHMTIFDMVLVVNRCWNDDKDDVLTYSEDREEYIIDRNAGKLSNELLWDTLKSCVG